MQQLKQQVFEANMDLPRYGLVTFTWGNVSAIDRQRGLVVIKPSGIAYESMTVDDMSVVDLQGHVVEGRWRPSSDTATHLALYRRYPDLGGVVHTHSTHATAWAQAGLAIPALGTTHADYFFGDIPCTRALSAQEVDEAYELNTGQVIIETLGEANPLHTPGIVVYQHGPFAWGKDAHEAVHNAVVMEEVARMAWIAHGINPQLQPIDSWLMNKHFQRKHGPKRLLWAKVDSALRGFHRHGETTGLAPEPFLILTIGRRHHAHADERDHANYRPGVKRRGGAEGFPQYPRAGAGQQQSQATHQIKHTERRAA